MLTAAPQTMAEQEALAGSEAKDSIGVSISRQELRLRWDTRLASGSEPEQSRW